MTAIKPRTARVVIYQGDDIAHLAELDEAVKRAEVAVRRAERSIAVRTLASPDPATEARDAHEAAVVARNDFAADAETRGVAVVMHAQPRKSWRDLMEQHPARSEDEHPEDHVIGPCNIESLPDVLLPMSIDREQSTIEGDTVEFLESLSDYDYYDRLFLTAFTLNRGSAAADPTQRLASGTSQTSAATSN